MASPFKPLNYPMRQISSSLVWVSCTSSVQMPAHLPADRQKAPKCSDCPWGGTRLPKSALGEVDWDTLPRLLQRGNDAQKRPKEGLGAANSLGRDLSEREGGIHRLDRWRDSVHHGGTNASQEQNHGVCGWH